jgi:Glyoxalase/Bleomycin resistance protein/Dioxygenase superfamily
VRIHDPDGNPISLSESSFGVPDERKVPGIRHIAYNAMDPEGMREFYSEIFGFKEVLSSFTYRKNGKLNRFLGDGFTNLAIHPFYNAGTVGHEMKFGINHLGFLVGDLKATMQELSPVLTIQKSRMSGPTQNFVSPIRKVTGLIYRKPNGGRSV